MTKTSKNGTLFNFVGFKNSKNKGVFFMKRLLLVFITSSALVLLTGCGKISELTDFEFSLDSIVSMFNSDETDEANKTDETTQDDESDDQAGNGQSADETDSNSTNEQINISDKSAENLYKQAIKIANEYESSQVDLKADQHLTFDGEVLESQSEYTILTSSNPNVTHQKGTTRLGGDQGQDISI